jgi:nucleoside-diphosphate-sugar epimerase
VIANTRTAFTAANITNRKLNHYSDITKAQEALAGCDTVIHLAGLAHNPQAQPQDYYRVNVDQSLAIAEAAVNTGIRRFIFVSSIKVNGEATTHTPFQHDDAPQPQDDYGRSKLLAEEKLQAYCADNAMELVIIRPPLIWGGNNKGNLATLEKAIRYRLPLPLADINNRRDWVSLDNLSSLLHQCLNAPNINREILLVSDGKPLSTTQIIQQLAQQMNLKALLFRLPQPVIKLIGISTKGKNIYNRLFGDLEVNINHTIKVTGWQPTNTSQKADV